MFPYIVRRCSADFLVMVIQFAILIPLLKKQKYVHLFPCPWGIIITLMRISKLFGKTWPWGGARVHWKEYGCNCKTHLRYLAAQLPWLVDLASLVCDMNWWLSCRVSALQSVVAGSISSGWDYGIHCWWDVIRSKQLSSVPVYRA